MENKDPGEVLGGTGAPYLNALAQAGASFSDAHAETHPSQPNYLALFSGSTQGVTDDSCDHSFDAPNLGAALLAAGRTFVGYAEALPRAGSTVCTAGRYARKHSPWVNFTDLPGATTNLPASALGTDWDRLPTVAFLTPDLCHDMHDCPVAAGDAWAKETLGSYLDWARTHNSLLVLTFDESETHTPGNPIATVLAGPMVTPGAYPGRINHYTLLRTIEDMYGLAPLGASADAPRSPASGAPPRRRAAPRWAAWSSTPGRPPAALPEVSSPQRAVRPKGTASSPRGRPRSRPRRAPRPAPRRARLRRSGRTRRAR